MSTPTIGVMDMEVTDMVTAVGTTHFGDLITADIMAHGVMVAAGMVAFTAVAGL